VLQQDLAGGEDAPAHRRLPVRFRLGRLDRGYGRFDLGHDDLDQAVHDGLLVGYVVVQRHGLDPERLGQAPHRERREPALIGDGDRRPQDPVPTEPDLRARRACSLRCHDYPSRRTYRTT
jgi:hypothetical protein